MDRKTILTFFVAVLKTHEYLLQHFFFGIKNHYILESAFFCRYYILINFSILNIKRFATSHGEVA